MRLTRKHLNKVLLSLPHPRLVEQGSIPPYIEIPVYKSNELIIDNPPHYDQMIPIKKLRFEYDPNEMDWVLKDLNI